MRTLTLALVILIPVAGCSDATSGAKKGTTQDIQGSDGDSGNGGDVTADVKGEDAIADATEDAAEAAGLSDVPTILDAGDQDASGQDGSEQDVTAEDLKAEDVSPEDTPVPVDATEPPDVSLEDTSNEDVSCVSDCEGKFCGGDGCGGFCGVCEALQSCVGGVCINGGEGGPCDENTTCECIADECLGELNLTDEICTVLFQSEACLDQVVANYEIVGCGAPCQGVTVPGLDVICTSPDCASAKAGIPVLLGFDACSAGCDCVPNCGGNTCGDNGCGGSCGSCGPNELCDAGQCVEKVEGDCAQNPTCECVLTECPIPDLPLPVDQVCDLLPSLTPQKCLDIILDAYPVEQCGKECNGISLPGLEEVCNDPECKGIQETISNVAANPCECFCKPQCGPPNKLCGDDGCGGSCGSCGPDKICDSGVCTADPGVCADPESCLCLFEVCELDLPGLPGGPDMLCGFIDNACLDQLNVSYQLKGCGDPCMGLKIPGFEAICKAPECAGMKAMMTQLIPVDPCPICYP